MTPKKDLSPVLHTLRRTGARNVKVERTLHRVCAANQAVDEAWKRELVRTSSRRWANGLRAGRAPHRRLGSVDSPPRKPSGRASVGGDCESAAGSCGPKGDGCGLLAVP